MTPFEEIGEFIENEERRISFDSVTKEELFKALEEIQEKAYSPVDDDWIWMDDCTPLGQYISSVIARIPFKSN